MKKKGSFLPNGEIIAVAPARGICLEPHSGYTVFYEIDNIESYDSSGYNGLVGRIRIENGPTFHVNADRLAGQTVWRALSCDDPGVDIARYNGKCFRNTGRDLSGVLADCLRHVIESKIDDQEIVYYQEEGVVSDMKIRNNTAFDRTAA
jgi:hypothetical protein